MIKLLKENIPASKKNERSEFVCYINPLSNVDSSIACISFCTYIDIAFILGIVSNIHNKVFGYQTRRLMQI